jgi:hypothetical protein
MVSETSGRESVKGPRSARPELFEDGVMQSIEAPSSWFAVTEYRLRLMEDAAAKTSVILEKLIAFEIREGKRGDEIAEIRANLAKVTEDHDVRLRSIEAALPPDHLADHRDMPGLQTVQRWVHLFVIGGISALLLFIAKTALGTP